VFHGDTIRSRTTVKEVRESKSRPNAGIVTFVHQGFNQRDEEVCVCTRQALMLRSRRECCAAMLFVPADSERKLAKSLGAPGRCADPRPRGRGGGSRKAAARGTGEFIAAQRRARAKLFVRINPLDTRWR
jgi:hypothetical protein